MTNLISNRIEFILPCESDYEKFYEAVSLSINELRPFLKWAQREFTLKDSIQYIKYYKTNLEKKKELTYFMWLKNSKSFLGVITFRNIDYHSKNAEIGYWVHSKFTKKGYMTEALKYMLEYAVNSLSLKTLTAFTYANNLISINLLKKMEFSQIASAINNEEREVLIYEKLLIKTPLTYIK